MTRILGLSGSLRATSLNAGLLRAAAEVVPEGVTIEIGSIRDVPLYDGDLETAEGIPAAVQRLQAQLKVADGLLLVTPEYNNSIPGVFKNTIDWMSRGGGMQLFAGKPVAVIGASPGGFGTLLSQNAWLGVLRFLKARQWLEGRLIVPQAGNHFDAEGNLTDDKIRATLREFVAGFAESIRAG
ncbi:MAG: NAD(P)H-dependent oxidoreductase [Rhodobacterales bacterium]|nr:NAD(P)H-dependent oxidoreductase [Rhodobacterales bacterium]